VPVAEEVFFIYPEGDWALSRVAKDPAHLLFKHYGEQVPASDWNVDGTKQGIYMMGPNGEYLEGAHAASGRADHLITRMQRALGRWEDLRKSAEYANQPVPLGAAVAPPEIEAAPFALRVSLRDLPREDNQDAGRRITGRDKRDYNWNAFTRWAWNQNWITFEDPLDFVPTALRKLESGPVEPAEPTAAESQASATEWEPVASSIVRTICRRVLVDNVRGQTPEWSPDSIQEATLLMRTLSIKDDLATIEYQGAAAMSNDMQSYTPNLFGQAVWNTRTRQFVTFSLVSIGNRTGAGVFNQRDNDEGPAPLGIVLDL
jgi:hypothetical protein